MKHKALTEPKPLKTFRDNYLAVVMMVAALFITSIISAQTDSAKYSRISGYGFTYKRWGGDSIVMVPLSSSPHTPYRPGGIRYNPGDSTLQLWTGHQWNSIVTGGTGIDTVFMLDDTTLTIETPDEVYFLNIPGRPRVDTIYRKPGKDSTFYQISGIEHAIKDSTGTSTTLSNTGSGYRLVKTASGQIKTVENTNTVTWDSTTNTLKANADTSYIATQSDLKDTAAAIRAAAGGSQNLDQVLTVGNTTTKEILSTADISGDSSLFKNFHFTRSGRVGSTTLSTPQPFPVYGSSITVGYGAISWATIMSTDWVQVSVINNAINGSGISTATPNNLYNRISTLPNYNSNYYAIAIEGGINDFLNNADTSVYKTQFGEIIDSIRSIRGFSPGIILIISPPFSPGFTGDSIYIGLNQRVAAAHGGVAIDIWHPLEYVYHHGGTDISQSDSLHLTLKGQEIVARTIALAANMGNFYGHLDVSGSDTVRKNRITYGDNTTYGNIVPLGSITQPVTNGGAIHIMNPGRNNGDHQDLQFDPDTAYFGTGIHERFMFRQTIFADYGSTFSLIRKSDNTEFRALHLNGNVQLLLGTDAPTPPTLDYTTALGSTYISSALVNGNLKINGDAISDAQRLRLYKNNGGLDVAAIGYNATYGLMLGSSTMGGTTIGDYSSVDGTSFTPVMNFPHNNLYNVLVGTTTDNTVGKLQVNGPITTVTDSTGSPFNMATIDANGKITKAAIPSGGISGTGISGRVAYWNGSSSLTNDANYLYSSSNNGTLSIGTTNTQGHLNIGGNKNLSSSGAQSYFAGATYTDQATSASGTANSYVINYFASPTIAAANTSVTFPNIYTVGIEAPTAGTNATITKRYALSLTGTGANLGMNGFIEGAYQIRSSSASGATISAGAGAGTGASGSVTGNDMAGKIDITTGTSPSTSGTVVTVTFNAAYATGPTVILTPGNAAAAALTGGTQVFVSSTSTTNFLVTSGSSALGASTQYIWYYHVIQ